MSEMAHESMYISEEREPIMCNRSVHYFDKEQDYGSKCSNSNTLFKGKNCEECCKNHKVNKKSLSSHKNFGNKGASTGTPTTFSRSSSLDNLSTSIDSLSDFKLPQQRKSSSVDNSASVQQVGEQDPCSCNDSQVDDPESHKNFNLFTEPDLDRSTCECSHNPSSSCESDSYDSFKKEKASNISSERKDSAPLLSDSFVDNLDAHFIEELCKCRENSSEGWSSYYELLNNLVGNSLKENAHPLNGERPFSYVHHKGEDISGLDDFDDEYLSNDAVVNRSTTSEDSSCQENLNTPSSFGVESVVVTDDNMKTSSTTVNAPEREKEAPSSPTSVPTNPVPSLSKSEKDFYRNLRYYFGGGKVKSRKSSCNVGDNDRRPQNKVMSEEPKTTCKKESGYSKSSSNNFETSCNKPYGSVGKQSYDHVFSKDHSNNVTNDEPKGSTICGGHTENIENLQKRKVKNLHSERKECRTSLIGDKAEHDADSQLPKFASRSKKEQTPNYEQTGTTFQTHRSKFMGRKPKETGYNGSTSAERRKHHSPIPQLKRRKSREKVEPLESIGNDTASCEKTKQKQAEPVLDFRWLISFSQLKKTGKTIIKRCVKCCGVVGTWLLTLAAVVISTMFLGSIHLGIVMYNRCRQRVVNSVLLSNVKRTFSGWYQRLKSWVKLSNKSMDRNHSFSLPKSGSDAIHQMMANKDSDPYSILGVTEDATDEDIKRQYRKLAVLVHPDKNSHPDADEAFKILSCAFDAVGTPEKRASFDREMRQQREEKHWEAGDEHPDRYFSEYRRKMREMKNHIYCESCDGKHRRYPTHRPVYAARYCAQCNTRHAAKEGDVWLESSMMGFKVHVYACMDHEIFEVTEWARCQKLNSMERIPADAHSVSLKIRTHSSRPSQSSRRSYPFRSEEDVLEDLLRNMFRHDFGDSPNNDFPQHSKPRKKVGRRKKRR